MEARISATDTARNLSDLLNRVRYRGERFLIVRGGVPVARLEPAQRSPSLTLGELGRLLDELPRPDEDFADALAFVIDERPGPPEAPWDS